MTLAILPNWLGDLVMVEPAVRALRRRGEVTGVVAPGLADLVEDCGLVDRLEIFDRRGRDRGIGGLLRAGRRLRGADRAWVFGPSLRAAALSAAARVPHRIGLGGAGREVFLTDVRRAPGPARSNHTVDTWLQMADPAEGADAVCDWSVGARGERGLSALLEEEACLTRPFAAFAISAQYGPTKELPIATFLAIAEKLSDRHGLVPVFVGGPAARERERARVAASATGGIDLAGRTDLSVLAAVLERASVFVGNDSGPMHLAAALGTPTLGIFGSTSPAWTAPRGKAARVIGPAEVDCSPCFRKTCPFDRECLTGIAPENVANAVTGLLGEST
jgi:heptosyltransferase-2